MQNKAIVRAVIYIFIGLVAVAAMYGTYGFYQSGTNVPMAVLEMDIVGNYSSPNITNATLELEHVRMGQVPNGEMDMPLPGVGIIVYSNKQRVSYASTQRYTGPGHYRFNIGFDGNMPQYNDELTMAVHFYDMSGKFSRAQLFARWRWNESEY